MRESAVVICAILAVIIPVNSLDSATKELVRINNEFASRFYQVLTWDSDDDLIFCPFCLMTTMAMTSLGSGGRTTSEIYTALGLPPNETAVLRAYRELTHTFTNQVKPTRQMFNGLFLSKSVDVDTKFEGDLRQVFNSTPYFFDPNKKRNAQIMDVIRRRLQASNNLFPSVGDSDFDDQAMTYTSNGSGDNEIILANYLDFKAGWEKRFDQANTKTEAFYVNGTSEIVMARTMRQTGHYFLTSIPELEAQALSIPYLLCDGSQFEGVRVPPYNRTLRSKPRRKKSDKNKKNSIKKRACKSGVKDSRLQMIILLPNALDGLEAMERKLTRETLHSIPKKFDYKTYLDLRLPRFELVSDKHVAQLSAQLLLDPESQDFSRISTTRPLFLGRSYHRVKVAVNERGSRTKSSLLKGINPWNNPRIVRVDHPFLAFIHDIKTDVILIVLRLRRPRSPAPP